MRYFCASKLSARLNKVTPTLIHAGVIAPNSCYTQKIKHLIVPLGLQKFATEAVLPKGLPLYPMATSRAEK